MKDSALLALMTLVEETRKLVAMEEGDSLLLFDFIGGIHHQSFTRRLKNDQ